MAGLRRVDPLIVGAESQAPDVRESEWYQFVEAIENLLATTGRFTWAEDTLRGIQQTVLRTCQVTPKQRQAVHHIEQEIYPRRRRR